MEGREDDGEAREGGLQRRGERGRDSAKDVLLEAEDGSLVRDEHLAHPRGERASIQAPAGAHPAPAPARHHPRTHGAFPCSPREQQALADRLLQSALSESEPRSRSTM